MNDKQEQQTGGGDHFPYAVCHFSFAIWNKKAPSRLKGRRC